MRIAHKYLVLASLYIVQSVPLSFLKTGFQTFLRQENISYPNISMLLSLMLLPWVFKFLWAPLVDKWCANHLPKLRNALLFFQIAGAGILGIVAAQQFPEGLQGIIVFFFLFSLMAATQDIVIDSLAVLTLPKKEHGLGNTFQIGGYYLGEILGGAAILIIFDKFGWNWAMAAFMLFFLVPFIPVLLFKTKQGPKLPPTSAKPFTSLYNFFKLPGMPFWLLVMGLYMGNQILSRTLLPSVFIDLGYTKTQIADVISIWGNTASVIGAVLGGVLVDKWGRKNCLVLFGILKVFSLLLFFFIDNSIETNFLYAIVIITDFIGGLATVTLYTIMMDKCRLNSPGTDFTVQQSTNQFAILIFVAISGILVNKTTNDFSSVYIVAMVVGIAAVLLAIFGFKKNPLDNGKTVAK